MLSICTSLKFFRLVQTMFSTLSKTEIIIYVTFILLSANAFNLDHVKFLSSGNGLKPGKESFSRQCGKRRKYWQPSSRII